MQKPRDGRLAAALRKAPDSVLQAVALLAGYYQEKVRIVSHCLG